MRAQETDIERSYDAVGQFAVFNLFFTLILGPGIGIIAAVLVVPLSAAGMPDSWQPHLMRLMAYLGVLLILVANFWLIRQARTDNVQGPILFAMAAYAVLATLLALFLGVTSPVIFAVSRLASLIFGGS